MADTQPAGPLALHPSNEILDSEEPLPTRMPCHDWQAARYQKFARTPSATTTNQLRIPEPIRVHLYREQGVATAPQLRRAQATASATSASVTPNSASLPRTASARVRRTGVRTIRPLSSVTSKYSTPGKSDTTFLGRVNWFFDVSLASNLSCSLFPYCKDTMYAG